MSDSELRFEDNDPGLRNLHTRIEEIRKLGQEGRLDEVHPSHLMVLIGEIDRLKDRMEGRPQ